MPNSVGYRSLPGRGLALGSRVTSGRAHHAGREVSTLDSGRSRPVVLPLLRHSLETFALRDSREALIFAEVILVLSHHPENWCRGARGIQQDTWAVIRKIYCEKNK